ncbi:Protein of unknown function [Gryllus bimaculatus]|nr:Protein of unknown function [Gryllus bimaculatus]
MYGLNASAVIEAVILGLHEKLSTRIMVKGPATTGPLQCGKYWLRLAAILAVLCGDTRRGGHLIISDLRVSSFPEWRRVHPRNGPETRSIAGPASRRVVYGVCHQERQERHRLRLARLEQLGSAAAKRGAAPVAGCVGSFFSLAPRWAMVVKFVPGDVQCVSRFPTVEGKRIVPDLRNANFEMEKENVSDHVELHWLHRWKTCLQNVLLLEAEKPCKTGMDEFL